MMLSSLKSKIVLYFSGLALCLIILGGTLWRIADIRSHLIAESEQRTELLNLANELRQTADDLSHTARTYVVTGDSTFKQYHREILAIREGELPRPRDYDHLYWGIVVASRKHPDAGGPSVPLTTLIRRHILTAEEEAMLLEVERHSKHMNDMEHRAMALVPSRPSRRPSAHPTNQAAPSSAARLAVPGIVFRGAHGDSAYVLLFGEPYYLAKTTLLTSIGAFITSVDSRTKDVALAGRRQVQSLSDMMLFVAVLTLLYAVLGWVMFSRAIANPLSTLLSTIGERVPREQTAPLQMEKGEIDALANVYEDLLHKLATGMQDLKRANDQLSRRSDELSAANAALAARTSLLDATLSNISQGVSVFDRDARLLTWNERYLSLYQFDPNKIRAGMPLEELMDLVLDRNDPHSDDVRREWGERIRSMTPFSVEETLQDGRVFEMQSTLTSEQLLVVTQTDISERKAIERVKNEFVSTVSHELRTPLTSIAGSLGLLAGGGAGDLPERAKKLVTIAYNNSQRLVRLVNDILDLEKIDAGKTVFKIVPTSIRQVVEQCIEASKGYADSFNVRIRLAANSADGVVNGDPDRLSQVFINLLSNATKFSPNGGFVDVEIRREGGMIRIAVRDHGRGIPAEFRSSIFNRFSQADASDRRQRGGTGLGLNIAKGIVEHHGGRITFESEEGQGTEFIVELPSWPPFGHTAGTETTDPQRLPAPATVTDAARNGAPHTSGNGKGNGASRLIGANGTDITREHVTQRDDDAPHLPRILHVEDDADIQSVVQASLEGVARVTSVASLSAARATLEHMSFDLVILDLQLPDGTGLELLPLRRNFNGQLTPTIIFSVEETDPPAVLQVVTALTKSRVSIDELVIRVKTVLARQRDAFGAVK